MENIKLIHLKYLDDLYKLPTTPAEGTIFKIDEIEQFYLISKDGTPLLIKGMTDKILENKKSELSFSFGSNADGEKWAEVYENNENAFVTGMTLYDLNKNLISQMMPLDDNELYEAAENILAFCEEQKNRYYMLLCHELRYFTLFNYHLSVAPEPPLPNVEEEVIACAHDIGSIISVDNKDDAIEIWVKTEKDEVFVMYFFPYDRGVIKCQ